MSTAILRKMTISRLRTGCSRVLLRSRRQRFVATTGNSSTSSCLASSSSHICCPYENSDNDTNHSSCPTFIQRRSLVMVTTTKADEPHYAPKVAARQSPADSTPPLTTTSVQPPPNDSQQLLIITDSCWKRIHQLITAKKQDDLYLRVFVDAGGCSGFTYQFELDTDDTLDAEEDVLFYETTDSKSSSSSVTARVVVDKGSLKLLAGSKIDYVQEMIKSSFEVKENPQSESACGCGSSFALKNFTSNPALD
jgi:iron-sulfur cluster assembly accessory protein